MFLSMLPKHCKGGCPLNQLGSVKAPLFYGDIMELYFKSETLNQDVQWIWTDMEKAYWQTWIPKKSNLKILSELSNKEMQLAKDELWNNLQDSIQFTRDQMNFKKRQKRLATKS